MLLSKYYYENYKESFSETLGEDKAYCGRFRLTDKLPETDLSVGEAILSPDENVPACYKRSSRKAQEFSLRNNSLHGRRTGKMQRLRFRSTLCQGQPFELPPIFKAIFESGEIPMEGNVPGLQLRTQNRILIAMLKLLRVLCNRQQLNISKGVGHVEKAPSDNNEVIIRYGGEEFEYK